MAGNVLFVCAQNVCRSPLMAATFEESLRAEGELGIGISGWQIESVGTHAHDGMTACAVAVSLAPAASEHLSVRLEAPDIDRADLVLVASLEERAAVARMRPDARSRSFTLREALLLGEAPVDASTLADYVSTLDARRGTIDLPRTGRTPWRRTPRNPLDIEDVHKQSDRAHRRGLEKAAADVRMLAAQVGRDLRAQG